VNEINKKLNVENEWKKVIEALSEARLLFEKDHPGGSISRAYYAVFHAGRSLLFSEGLETRSHQGLGRLFSLHFVKTGRFDARFSRILSKAQKYREEADYSADYVFTIGDAGERLKEVGEFISAAENFLRAKGFLAI